MGSQGMRAIHPPFSPSKLGKNVKICFKMSKFVYLPLKGTPGASQLESGGPPSTGSTGFFPKHWLHRGPQQATMGHSTLHGLRWVLPNAQATPGALDRLQSPPPRQFLRNTHRRRCTFALTGLACSSFKLIKAWSSSYENARTAQLPNVLLCHVWALSSLCHVFP